jgi:dipeptidyl-peptidase-4
MARKVSGKIRPRMTAILLCVFMIAAPALSGKPKKDASLLTIDRIFNSKEFDSKSYSAAWLPDGSGYTRLEIADGGGQNLVCHDPQSGATEIMVSAAELTPHGESEPLKIDSYSLSKDQSLLLICTNSKLVWRQKTRGDYWILDRAARQLRKLGGDAPPSTLMFAKISPAGNHVAYVREQNIYLEDLRDHTIKALTESGNDKVINGTFDWVYEEELSLRDGFRWSPDGKSIAYWQINTKGVREFPLINNTDTLYPEVTWFAYPKTGQKNSSCRVGVVNIASAKTQWMQVPGDPRNHYIARMDWAESSREIVLQQLNRLQNTNRVMLADARTGKTKTILTEHDDAWVDTHDELKWLDGGRQFTWISERDGWRQVYLVSRDGGQVAKVTPGEFDVIQLLSVDEEKRQAYFIASPDNPSQRFLYRIGLDGTGLERLTPSKAGGTHTYRIAPDFSGAIHTVSSFDDPPMTDLVEIPSHKKIRMLEGNKKLRGQVRKLSRRPTEFMLIDIGDGVELDGWMIKPPELDPRKKYPLLINVYGEPMGQTTVDRWGGSKYLWHLMMAQRGYVVMSVDNRGTAGPRGRDWRKYVYRKIGILAPQDQAEALQAILKERPYLDGNRVGIWGSSGGGSMSLNAIFKYPDLYHTAMALSPVPNQRYYDTIYQERYMDLPSQNVEGYRDGSPINFAHQLKGSLLLIHGTGDDNCHYATMEMLINELILHNKQFSSMMYPNRTHSLGERKNTTRHRYTLMTNYLMENLSPQAAIPSSEKQRPDKKKRESK